jgi:hypothetical protein
MEPPQATAEHTLISRQSFKQCIYNSPLKSTDLTGMFDSSKVYTDSNKEHMIGMRHPMPS